jgi:hypothetical protein
LVWSWSYESSAVGDAQTHLLDIVRSADLRNAEKGASGVLAYDEYGFYQVLEGPFDAITELRRSILRDRRHRVNWERVLPRRKRWTPVSLPLAFIHTKIPHGDILKRDNAHTIAAFESSLLDRAAQAYPRSFAHGTGPAGLATGALDPVWG